MLIMSKELADSEKSTESVDSNASPIELKPEKKLAEVESPTPATKRAWWIEHSRKTMQMPGVDPLAAQKDGKGDS